MRVQTVHDDTLSSNLAEELVEDFGPVTHEWGTGEPTGIRSTGKCFFAGGEKARRVGVDRRSSSEPLSICGAPCLSCLDV